MASFQRHTYHGCHGMALRNPVQFLSILFDQAVFSPSPKSIILSTMESAAGQYPLVFFSFAYILHFFLSDAVISFKGRPRFL